MELEKNNCTCGGIQSKNLFNVEDLNFGAVTCSSMMLVCLKCDSKRPSHFPIERDVHLGYQNYYTTNKKLGGFVYFKRLIARINKKYKRRYIDWEYSKLLDFGCGSGDFLSMMVQTYPIAQHYGTDFLRSPLFSSSGAKWIGNDELDNYAPYDLVTLGHVIEHLKYPDHYIKRLSSLLESKGKIIIITPNSKSPILKIFRKYARDFDFPRHRIIFSKKEIQRLLNSYGLKKIDEFSSPITNSILNILSSLRCVKNKDNNLASRLKYLFLSLLTIILILMIKFLKLTEYEPEIIVVAEKQ